jgi:hypothetical protein
MKINADSLEGPAALDMSMAVVVRDDSNVRANQSPAGKTETMSVWAKSPPLNNSGSPSAFASA